MQTLEAIKELSIEARNNLGISDTEGVDAALVEIWRMAERPVKVYVLTKLPEVFAQPGPLVRGLYPTAEAAMLAHNRFYFGDDHGVKFALLEGWQTAAEYNADDNCPPINMVEPTQDVWVFNDEGDLVFVMAMEVTA